MSRGQLVTFYSYKGGVGRTFLLVNVAAWLSKAGFKILCIDFDLEAPGLHHYFRNQGLLPRPSGKGVRNLLRQAPSAEHLDWRGLVQPMRITGAPHPLDLIEAGTASEAREESLSYSDLYLRHGLGDKLEAAREEWLESYDLILVDSRTGLTDIGGICAAQLPDVLVAVLAPNQQGIEGTLDAVTKAQRERRALPIPRGGFRVVPVLGRFDISANSQSLGKWMKLLTEKLTPILEEWLAPPDAAEKLTTLLRVPYLANWSFGEPIPVLDSDEPHHDSATVVYAVATVASLLARRLEDTDQLCTDRDGYVDRVLKLGPAILPPDAADATSAEAFAFDLFLSFSGPELRLIARDVAAALKALNFRVFFDEMSIEGGKRWREALAEGLEKSRGLVALVPEFPSSWQRAEVDLLRAEHQTNPDRFLLPIWMEPRPAWPELFAFQGFDGRGLSAIEIAQRINEKLRRPASPAPVREEKPWTAADALAAYRRHTVDRHSKLIPYFAGASDLLLEQIFVRVDVAPLKSRGLVEHPEEEGPGNPRKPESEPVLLDDLLLSASKRDSAPRLLLIGDPGAGKTTLCRALTRQLAESEGRVPLFLPLAVLPYRPFEPVLSAAADFLGQDALHTQRGKVLTDALSVATESGNAVLFLDGLDEVAAEHVDDLFAAIVAYAAAHRSTAIVVSGRSIAFERLEAPRHFQRIRVQPLPRDRQDELLSKLLSASDAAEVRRHIDRHPALADLAQSPLLLTLLAVVARDTALAETGLPNSRTKLYDTVVSLLLRRGFGIHKHGVHDTNSARRLLQLLSFELHNAGGESWTQPALSEVLTTLRERHSRANFLVKENWDTNDRFLDDIGRNAGILGPHDSPTLPWRYLHRSLREFLAAEELSTRPKAEVLGYLKTWIEEVEADEKAKNEQARAERGSKSTKPAGQNPAPSTSPSRPDPQRWGEVFALYAGLATNPSPILDALGQQSPPLALRTLKAIDALAPERLLNHLLQFEGWTDTDLTALLDLWGKSSDSAASFLNAAIRPGLPIQNLGLLWCALEGLGHPPRREDFFSRAGLWPEGGPPLPDLVPIPPSGEPFEFLMGSPEGVGEDHERPQVQVRLSPFRLARRTVTWREFNQFRQAPADFELPNGHTPDHPAAYVSWWPAYLYCRWLGGSLPTEAQWEGACRAGTQSVYWFGDDPSQLSKHAWFGENSGDHPHPSDPEHANPWGLEEMHGNVWEWCLDSGLDYSELAADTTATDPSASPRGSGRVVRGGSCWSVAVWCRSAYRSWGWPWDRDDSLGFRVAFPAAPSFDT